MSLAETDGKGHLPPGDILLGVDGEPHTEAAMRWALSLASALGRRIVALHVEDPYLKKFEGELYAQGRREYLQHIDECLEEGAAEALAAFERCTSGFDVDWAWKVRQGNPAEELIAEAKEGVYGLLVVGASSQSGGLLRSRTSTLAARMLMGPPGLPVLVVPAPEE